MSLWPPSSSSSTSQTEWFSNKKNPSMSTPQTLPLALTRKTQKLSKAPCDLGPASSCATYFSLSRPQPRLASCWFLSRVRCPPTAHAGPLLSTPCPAGKCHSPLQAQLKHHALRENLQGWSPSFPSTLCYICFSPFFAAGGGGCTCGIWRFPG